MKLIIDTREQQPLEFIKTEGVEIVKEYLPVGDYSARHGDDNDAVVVERKSLGDLFASFTARYEAERAKIIRAKTRGLKYVLAIEGTLAEVRKGYTYEKGGDTFKVGKDGLSQLRQLMTIARKYDVEVHYFVDRGEMAFWIMEYFLARERVK